MQDDSAEIVTKVVAKSLLTIGIPAFTEGLRAGSASTVCCGFGLCVMETQMCYVWSGSTIPLAKPELHNSSKCLQRNATLVSVALAFCATARV